MPRATKRAASSLSLSPRGSGYADEDDGDEDHCPSMSSLGETSPCLSLSAYQTQGHGTGFQHLQDHGYGVTPQHQIMREAPTAPPKTSEAVKRRLNLSGGEPTSERGRVPRAIPMKAELKTPKRKRRNESPSPWRTREKRPAERASRFDTSLSLLTKKFVRLLETSPDGVVDLNVASEKLDVQKRRIYDITNVLEGIGILEKKSKNNIQWKCGNSDSQEENQQRRMLKKDLKALSAKERELDDAMALLHGDLRSLNRDKKFAYITYSDLRSVAEFKNRTLIPVKAPPETSLNVPPPDENGYVIHMKAESGEIEVYLCPSETPPATPPSDPLLEDHRLILKPLIDDIRQQNSALSPLRCVSNLYSPPIASSSQCKLSPKLLNHLKKTVVVGAAQRNLTETLSSQPSDSAKWHRPQRTVSRPILDLRSETGEICIKKEEPEDNVEVLRDHPQPDIREVCKVRNALIADCDDFGPIGGEKFQFHTEDQMTSDSPDDLLGPFYCLEPPLTDSDYIFSLDSQEGLEDLFDFDLKTI